MPETDYASLEGKTPGDRTVMHVLYGMHTVSPFTFWTLSLVALVVHYVKRSDERDPMCTSWSSTTVSRRGASATRRDR